MTQYIIRRILLMIPTLLGLLSCCNQSGPMKIAVLAGDGIGPEIVAQAVKVLDVLKRDGLKLELERAPYGGAGCAVMHPYQNAV